MVRIKEVDDVKEVEVEEADQEKKFEVEANKCSICICNASLTISVYRRTV